MPTGVAKKAPCLFHWETLASGYLVLFWFPNPRCVFVEDAYNTCIHVNKGWSLGSQYLEAAGCCWSAIKLLLRKGPKEHYMLVVSLNWCKYQARPTTRYVHSEPGTFRGKLDLQSPMDLQWDNSGYPGFQFPQASMAYLVRLPASVVVQWTTLIAGIAIKALGHGNIQDKHIVSEHFQCRYLNNILIAVINYRQSLNTAINTMFLVGILPHITLADFSMGFNLLIQGAPSSYKRVWCYSGSFFVFIHWIRYRFWWQSN